jgi:hypothetical protein
METRFYQTQDIDVQRIAEVLVLEYQAQGFVAQQGGTPEQVLVQLKKESTLRAVTGFNKALAVTMQKVQGGTLVKVGAQDWVDQIAVGAVGLALHPLLITAGIGALTQYDVVNKLLSFIDQQIRQQQPSATLAVPPVTI